MPDRNEQAEKHRRDELAKLRRERDRIAAQIATLEGGDGEEWEDESTAGDKGDLHKRIAAAEARADWNEVARLKAKLVELVRKERG